MLNTKYIIINDKMPPLVNDYRLGNAWFVNSVIAVNNPDEEIAKLKEVNPAYEAVISKKFLEAGNTLEQIKSIESQRDTNAVISLISYAPNKLVYAYNSSTPQITIFSEMYYKDGWEAYIEQSGEKLNLFQADWVLSGAITPAGDYNIVFTLNPQSFRKGEVISKIASGILFLLVIAGISAIFVNRKRKK